MARVFRPPHVTLGSLGRCWDVAATMMGCSEDKKQLPPAIISDLQAPLPASHPRNSGSKLPQLMGKCLLGKGPSRGREPLGDRPSPGTGAGVGLAGRHDFEGRAGTF